MTGLNKNNLFISGIDDDAANLAQRYGLGIEVTDFCYPPMLEDTSVPSRLKEQLRGIKNLWLHAPFGEFCACAIDPLVRDIAFRRYTQAAHAAAQLGIKRMVVHGGFIPNVYFPEWYTEQSVLFWKGWLAGAPDDITIALENTLDVSPVPLAEIVRAVGDSRLGICLDVGHAAVSGSSVPLSGWIDELGEHIIHLHLHDNHALADEHLPLGQGSIDYASVLRRLLTACPDATFTLENRHSAPSLAWLGENGWLQI